MLSIIYVQLYISEMARRAETEGLIKISNANQAIFGLYFVPKLPLFLRFLMISSSCTVDFKTPTLVFIHLGELRYPGAHVL